MRVVRLAKAHGLGNDFLLLLDPRAATPINAEMARRLCDRHRGVGADGLIRITTDPGGGFAMELRNSDGGAAEVSGNGLRCVARYLRRRGLVDGAFSIRTAAGTKSIAFEGDDISVDLGVPLPLDSPRGPSAGGLDVVAVSLGNPHLVVFVDDPATADVGGLGPKLEVDDAYPERTNVEFAVASDRQRVAARIWERGVGETEASGTGGSACAVAARMKGLVDRVVTVVMPGGELRILWEGEGSPVMMTGPAQVLFEVEVDVDALG